MVANKAHSLLSTQLAHPPQLFKDLRSQIPLSLDKLRHRGSNGSGWSKTVIYNNTEPIILEDAGHYGLELSFLHLCVFFLEQRPLCLLEASAQTSTVPHCLSSLWSLTAGGITTQLVARFDEQPYCLILWGSHYPNASLLRLKFSTHSQILSLVYSFLCVSIVFFLADSQEKPFKSLHWTSIISFPRQ